MERRRLTCRYRGPLSCRRSHSCLRIHSEDIETVTGGNEYSYLVFMKCIFGGEIALGGCYVFLQFFTVWNGDFLEPDWLIDSFIHALITGD